FPPCGPHVTSGCGEMVSVAKLTLTLVAVMSVRYGYRVSTGAAARAPAVVAGSPISRAMAAARVKRCLQEVCVVKVGSMLLLGNPTDLTAASGLGPTSEAARRGGARAAPAGRRPRLPSRPPARPPPALPPNTRG